MSLGSAIIEHLKTKGKYNDLKINYLEALRLIEERTAERNAIERDYRKMEAKFDQRVNQLLDKNIQLKKKILEQREKIKEAKNEKEEQKEKKDN